MELAHRPEGPTSIEVEIVEMLTDVVDWEVDLGEPVSRDTLLVADLGFQSLDIVMLILAIEGRYQRSDLPFDDLLMVDGSYVVDLRVGELVAFLARHVGEGGAR